MANRIQLRRDTAANWTSVNPVLADGEPGLESDTGKEKIGNGTDSWNELPYQTGAPGRDGKDGTDAEFPEGGTEGDVLSRKGTDEVEWKPKPENTNIANANLTADDDREHDFDGKSLAIKNLDKLSFKGREQTITTPYDELDPGGLGGQGTPPTDGQSYYIGDDGPIGQNLGADSIMIYDTTGALDDVEEITVKMKILNVDTDRVFVKDTSGMSPVPELYVFGNDTPVPTANVDEVLSYEYVGRNKVKISIEASDVNMDPQVHKMLVIENDEIKQVAIPGNNNGGGASEVTYAELMSLISTNDLVPGQVYLVSDFQTVHYIVDANDVQHDTNTGALEPLLVRAVNDHELDKEAKSSTFPKDIIYVDHTFSCLHVTLIENCTS